MSFHQQYSFSAVHIPNLIVYKLSHYKFVYISLRTGPLSSDGLRESGESEGKEGLHTLYCSSSILHPEFGRKTPIG